MAETFTDIHSLSKFSQGERFPVVSAAKLNANWDQIDANMVKAATSFPSTFPLNKVLMRTDVPAFYVNTGTPTVPEWTLIPAAAPSIDMASIMMVKDFFIANGRMPSTILKEAVHEFPALDFSFLNGGSLAITKGSAKFTGSSRGAVFGWDLGAGYKRTLSIFGMNRAASFRLIPMIFSGVPVDIALTGITSYQFWIDVFGGSFDLIGPGGTLATLTTPAPPAVAQGPNLAVAIYYSHDDSVLEFYVRYGGENWIQIGAFTNNAIASIRAVGWSVDNQGAAVEYLGCPLGVYGEN